MQLLGCSGDNYSPISFTCNFEDRVTITITRQIIQIAQGCSFIDLLCTLHKIRYKLDTVEQLMLSDEQMLSNNNLNTDTDSMSLLSTCTSGPSMQVDAIIGRLACFLYDFGSR